MNRECDLDDEADRAVLHERVLVEAMTVERTFTDLLTEYIWRWEPVVRSTYGEASEVTQHE